MAIVEWSDEFRIGESAIDREHWGLFALIRDLANKLALGAAEGSLTTTIEALVVYVNVHFEHEERLMRETGYPAFAAHKKAHEALARRVAEFQQALRRDPQTFDFEAFMEFLSNWLSEHIIKLDMQFAAYHKEQLAAV